MEVVNSVEQERGCGYRKPSASGVGIYLMGGGLAEPCGRLPLPLDVCPCCSSGIKPARSWTWIVPSQLFAKAPACRFPPTKKRNGKAPPVVDFPQCQVCPVGSMPAGRHGLLWIGEGFYKTPADFVREATRLGISRKISAIPKDFVLGETWVYLAHRFAYPNADPEGKSGPGVFTAFKPSRVDLVIDDENNIPERAVKLAEELGDGARIVRVERAQQQLQLPMVAS